jgi:single-stranded-DNA-specific exonuclease
VFLKTVQERTPAYNPGPEAEGDRLHPVVKRVLANRGIDFTSGLDHGLKHLLSLDELKGSTKAARRIVLAIEQQQSILIVGDYDADGATSTALAIKGLRSMGLKQIAYKVPNRFSYGYGLSLKLAQDIIVTPPDIVITVDNGISSIEGIDCLNDVGVDVIVTDHHLSGDKLPAAYAIVNPNQPGCKFADKSIAGVGVMFYVLLCVNRLLRDSGYYEKVSLNPNLLNLLDLVALGTVADVVALGRNNRILVSQGIARMRAGRIRPGIEALLKIGGRDCRSLVAQDLGFIVGPRLNASGRLDDISSGIECLLADDPLYAAELAEKLDQINRTRKDIEQSMQTQALQAVKKIKLDAQYHSTGMVLFDPCWHEGVVGLVASRIKEKSGVPVLVFAPGEEGLLKGSARSIPEVHIRDVLANIDASQPRLIERFGGHAMAAGLSIYSDNLDVFRRAFEVEVGKALAKRPPGNILLTDGVLGRGELNRQFAETIKTLLPWGQACPEPLFEGAFEVLNSRFVGEIHLKLVLRLSGEREPVDAIYFRYLDSPDAPEKRMALEMKKIHAVYSLDVNHFRGKQSLQLLIRHLRKNEKL